MSAPRKSSFFSLATALLLLFMQTPAHGDYPPRMQSADIYFHDWTYSAISPDRHWLAYSSNAQLVVVDTTGASAVRKFGLPMHINGLAIANDGRRLVVVRVDDSTALIDLNKPVPGAAPGNLDWTPLLQGCEATVPAEPEPDRPAHVPPQPIALSGDGRYMAVRGGDCESNVNFIRVSDLNTRAAPRAFPLADPFDISAFDFIDGDSKLAVFGEQLHALWDLRSGTLLNSAFFATDSEDDSKFAVGVDRGTAQAYVNGEKGRVAHIDLGDCSKPVTASSLPAEESILTIGAGNNWYAVAKGAQIDVFQTAGNRHVAGFKAPFDVAYLTQGRDPGSLFAVSRTKSDASQVQSDAVIPKDAQHAMFRLPKELALASPAPAKKTWPQCRMLDEAPGARDINHSPAPATHLAEVVFHDCGANHCGHRSGPDDRPIDGCSFDSGYPPWGQTAQGEIWIDHCTDIIRIDPRGGAVLEKLPTPRNGKFVAITWFERGGFLNWQGDTVTFRSFHGERKVLVSKTGWHVLSAFVEGRNTFGVLWGQNKFMDANKGQSHKLGPMGSGLAVRYDFDTLQVQAQQNAAALTPYDGQAWQGVQLIFDTSTFEAETEGAPPTELEQRAEIFNAYNFHRTPLQAEPEFRWELFIFDSLRMLSIPATGQARAVMWDGLTSLPGKPAAAHAVKIFDLGSAKAAVVRQNGDIDLYDGKERRILTHIAGQTGRSTSRIEWLVNGSVLALDSCGRSEGDNCRLVFYAVRTAK
jgi:hypothetical protein